MEGQDGKENGGERNKEASNVIEEKKQKGWAARGFSSSVFG
jgi:hypothetical protein